MSTMFATAIAFFTMLADHNKIDANKLVGTWQQKERPATEPADIKFPQPTLNLTKNAALTVTVFGSSSQGTYIVRGNKITVREQFGTEKLVSTLTIVKLTDSELILKGPVGTEEYIRVEGK